MRGFIPRATLYKKAAAMAVVVGGLGAGLHLFSSYQDAFETFRWYHLQAHGVAMGNTLEQVERSSASAALALTRGEQLRYTQHNDVKPAQSIPVLVYHGVMARSEGNNIALEQFAEQLLALQAAGYQTVALDDFSQFMRGDKELPDQSFLLTFDDGRKDSFYPVDPILKALDYQAVMFVITKHALGGDSRRSHFYLSERELKNMLNTGRWDIQSHGKDDHDFYAIDDQGTQGHFLSHRLYLEERGRIENIAEFGHRIFTDLTISKRELEDTLGRVVISFAYPFGDFGQNSINFPESEVFIADAVQSVYDFAFYQGWPELGDTFNYPDPGAFMIKRINVQPHWSGEHLVQRLDRGRAKKLPYKDDFAQDKGWIKTWGRSDVTDGSLELSSHATNTGASVFLDGTRHWRDYRFEAPIDWQHGQSVSLIARFQDSENFVACTFTDVGIQIEERVNGAQRLLEITTLDVPIAKEHFAPSIRVAGDTATCLMDDKLVAQTSELNPSLRNGGIGFKTWDAISDHSNVRIQRVRVSAILSEQLAKSAESL